MTIGEKLTALRQRKGLTQEEFCADFSRRFRDMPINRKQYGHWETDDRTMQLMHFRALVKYYRISADDLLFDDRKPDGIGKGKVTKRAANVLQ